MSNASKTKQSEDSDRSISVAIDQYQWLTVRQFCVAFPWPSESAMRSYIYRADELGISEAFVRIGRRLLIIPQMFFSLIKQVENRSNKGGKHETTSMRQRKNGL